MNFDTDQFGSLSQSNQCRALSSHRSQLTRRIDAIEGKIRRLEEEHEQMVAERNLVERRLNALREN
jgi:predicted  nucleic acid-binding Zn-ribbon protein